MNNSEKIRSVRAVHAKAQHILENQVIDNETYQPEHNASKMVHAKKGKEKVSF